MKNNELSGGIRSLLGEYRQVINELIEVIRPLREEDIAVVVDPDTKDGNCRSIQSILTHVVCSGYGYTVYLENAMGQSLPKPPKRKYNSAEAYIGQLNSMYDYCEKFFLKNPVLPLEEYAGSKIIFVSWGQRFDVEQLMEHAIVHIMRHRRQIENFIRNILPRLVSPLAGVVSKG